MPRHTPPLLHRFAPLKRASATAGLTVAALVVGVGGYTVATSPALAEGSGDRLVLSSLLGGTDEVAAGTTDPAAARSGGAQEASRSFRPPIPMGVPSTSAQAQEWVDEVYEMEATLDQVHAAEVEAARVAAEAEAARVAAEAEAARVAAEQEAARVAAEAEAARVAAEEEAARVAAAEAAEAAARAEREAAEAAAASVATDPGSNRALGQQILAAYGFGGDQWSCLDKLWQKESGWSHTADNPSSSAYGIPQSLPGSKMASAGSDWETNPETQIRWGLGYIQGRYGTPCAAWAHSQANNWY